MTMIRMSGLGATVFASAIVLAIGCDSGGSTLSPTNAATDTGTGTGTGTANGGSGNTTSATGGKSGTTTSSTGGKATTSSTGTGTTTGTTTGACPTALPTATGTLSISNGYVTSGTLQGYGFAWKGTKSNTSTCIAPTCGSTGCTPLFGSTALCAIGTVTSDSSYNSIVGVGMNLNQAVAGGDGSEKNISAPASVTVGATLDAATAGYARVQIVSGTGDAAINYCVEAGSWSPGAAIPITSFNTSCWDTTATGATALAAGTQITSIDIVIPSSATADRPFNMCLTGVTM